MADAEPQDEASAGAGAMPVRQLSRIVTEFHCSANRVLQDAVPARFAEAIVFEAIARVCLPDWVDADDRINAPPAPQLALPTHRLAVSLSRSAETTRRHVTQLVEAGLLVRIGDGVAVATTGDGAARMIAYLRAMHDLYVRLVEDVEATCAIDWTVGRVTGAPVATRDLLVRALDLNLIGTDQRRTLSRDYPMLALWIAISALNTRHITYDADLSRRYSVASSPDSIRRPVPLARVAQVMGVPYASAWRLAAKMAEAGLVEQVAEGWVVRTAHLRQPAVEEVVTRNMAYLVRRIRELRARGLKVGAIGARYLDGRPALIG